MLNSLYSGICIVCSNALTKSFVCKSCALSFKLIKDLSTCFSCGTPFGHKLDSQNLCNRCLKEEFSFKKARSIAFYDGQIRELLYDFKYRKKLAYSSIFCELIINNFPSDIDHFDLVVPVPLHIKRLREREYNQSAIIAYQVSKKIDCDYNPFVLSKNNNTEPQVNFNDLYKRKGNVRDSFTVRDFSKVKNKEILLVDDVFTTGSTSNECSKALLRAGASGVQVLTALRASV